MFDGRDLLKIEESELRRVRGVRVSLITQDPAASLNPVIRVGEQISEVLLAHLKMNRGERKNRVKELLGEVGFDDAERIYAAYPHQLSGRQRQRVVIAQAMACRSALVIADELTSKLDSVLQAQIVALMLDLVRQHRTGLLWITHDWRCRMGLSAGEAVQEPLTMAVVDRIQRLQRLETVVYTVDKLVTGARDNPAPGFSHR